MPYRLRNTKHTTGPTAIPVFSTTKRMVYKPTDRERQRYVVYEGADPLPTFAKLYGTMGKAAAGIQVKGKTIRTTSAYVDHVKAAICLTPGCRSLKVSGALKHTR